MFTKLICDENYSVAREEEDITEKTSGCLFTERHGSNRKTATQETADPVIRELLRNKSIHQGL